MPRNRARSLVQRSRITPPLRGSRREGGARSRAGGGQTRRSGSDDQQHSQSHERDVYQHAVYCRLSQWCYTKKGLADTTESAGPPATSGSTDPRTGGSMISNREDPVAINGIVSGHRCTGCTEDKQDERLLAPEAGPGRRRSVGRSPGLRIPRNTELEPFTPGTGNSLTLTASCASMPVHEPKKPWFIGILPAPTRPSPGGTP